MENEHEVCTDKKWWGQYQYNSRKQKLIIPVDFNKKEFKEEILEETDQPE